MSEAERNRQGEISRAFQEHERGSIEPGKQADFSVFASDLMTIPEKDILQARLAMTIIGGEMVMVVPLSTEITRKVLDWPVASL